MAQHLVLPGYPRERVLAAAFRLLDLGFFRMGGEQYADENGSYGLATMRREHVSIDGGSVVFDYPAKNDKQRIQHVADDDLRAVFGADATAKDLRTWHATVLMAVALAVSREVADYLGNTPAVARASYVDPRIIDLYDDGRTVLGRWREPAGTTARPARSYTRRWSAPCCACCPVEDRSLRSLPAPRRGS